MTGLRCSFPPSPGRGCGRRGRHASVSNPPKATTAPALVLDGRNRLEAATRAGVTPLFTVYEGDPAAFVLRANVGRRHMSTGQRAMATAMVLAADGKRENGRWKHKATDDLKSSESRTFYGAVSDAGTVLDHSPDLAAQVLAGSVALSAAVDAARTAKRAAESDAAAWAHLQVDAPDLAELVTDGCA